MSSTNNVIRVTGLYENVSKVGNRYFVGYMASVKLVIFANKGRKTDKDPAWTLLAACGRSVSLVNTIVLS